MGSKGSWIAKVLLVCIKAMASGELEKLEFIEVALPYISDRKKTGAYITRCMVSDIKQAIVDLSFVFCQCLATHLGENI